MKNTAAAIDFSTVLASAVHDMKNSLCMLIQSAELIQQESAQLSDSAREELARLNYEANRLNSNLLQLLSLYRMEKNQLPIQVDQHYLSDLTEEIVLKNQYYCQQRGLNIQLDSAEDLSWYFDYDLVLHLVNDAVVNALRYCDKKILIRLRQQDSELLIEIHDDGPGFPAFMLSSEQERMNAPDLANSHTGLGIFFAKLIAGAHHNKGQIGKVTLFNGGQYGGGVFIVTLP